MLLAATLLAQLLDPVRVVVVVLAVLAIRRMTFEDESLWRPLAVCLTILAVLIPIFIYRPTEPLSTFAYGVVSGLVSNAMIAGVTLAVLAARANRTQSS